MGFSTSCKYGMPTAWQQNNTNNQNSVCSSHLHLCYSDEIKIPWLTFMNCSIALEASELERNKVFGSAGEAEEKRRKIPQSERQNL